MTHTIAPPTLEELNERIDVLEANKVEWADFPNHVHVRKLNIELYCLYAVREGVGAKRQTELEDANNACIELAAKHGYATGHGDTVGDIMREFNAQIPDRAQSPWMGIETAPPLEIGDIQEYVIAVYRKRTNKVHTFACSYLKSYPLHYEDTDFCPNKTCDDGPCSDGCPTTGWFTLVGEDDEAGTYYRLALYDGDKLMGWREMPQWDLALPPTHNSPPDAALSSQGRGTEET